MARRNKLTTDTPWTEIRSTAADWKKAGRDGLLTLLHRMQLIRAFEESVLELASEQLVHGPAHSSIGQEGAAVGSIVSLVPGDQINGSHRSHHQFIAKALGAVLDGQTVDPAAKAEHPAIAPMLKMTLAEIMGLEPGMTHGRGGSMHLRWAEAGVIGSNAIVGGGVPFALGAAWSRKQAETGDVAMTYFGDGALNIGAVLESLNLAAVWKLPICFFVENNQVAVATTVAEATRETRLSARGQAFGIPSYTVDGMDPLAVKIAMDEALGLLRAGKGPVIVEADCYRYYHQSGPLLGSAFDYRTKEEEEAWKARDPIRRVAREMLDRGFLSTDEDQWIRERSIATMSAVVSELVEPEGNGRRIIPALWPKPETVDAGLRSTGAEFDGVVTTELERFTGKVAETKFIDAVAAVMDRRMARDARVLVIGEDIHRLRGGTNGATKGLYAKYPDRILPTPICEQTFAGFAGGVAVDGRYRPVVEFMYPDFSLVACDQLFNQIGKARHMFGDTLSMPLVVRTKVAMGSGYGSQHSMDPVGMFALFPGWRIVAPSMPFDYVGLMNSALTSEDPVLVVEHVDLYAASGPGPVDDFDLHVPLGKAKVVRPGGTLTVVTYLAMVAVAQRVVERLGLDAEVIDLRSLDRAGLDWQTIEASVRKTNALVVLEQGPLTASYGQILADEAQRRLFDWLDAPVMRIHGGDASPTISKALEQAAITTEATIEAGLRSALSTLGRGSAMAAG